MKKFCFIFLTLILMLITVGCVQTPPADGLYTVKVINGVIKDENVTTKKVELNTLVTVIHNGDAESFIGWYVQNSLVSEDAEYSFEVTKNITVEARFNETGLKSGYYLLTNKVENGLDITNSYVFNALLIENGKATWYEVDYTGATEQNGITSITADVLDITIGLKKYSFKISEDYSTLTFENKINRIPVKMEYEYQKDFTMPEEQGQVNFTDELFGDNIEENFYNYCPSIMIENGTTMHVWYCSNKDSGKVTDYIAYRKGTLSTDGKWTFSEKELVLQPTPNTWDKVHVCDPSVIKGEFKYNGEDYNYLMAYLGCRTTNVTANEVGVAVSKNPNGPWVKIENLNPIADYYKAIEQHGKADNWKNAWGYGQPSLVSIDKAGKIMLFYTAGTPNATETIAEEWDLSDLNNPVMLSQAPLSNAGVTSASGQVDCINNADFAYDPATKRIICVKEDFPYPTDGNTNWITGSNTLLYVDLDEDEVSPMHSIVEGSKKTWIKFSAITEALTGYKRNHNCGLVTDEYGWVLSSTSIGVVYTSSMLRTDFPDWNGSGQWPALHTYRLHGIVLDLPR